MGVIICREPASCFFANWVDGVGVPSHQPAIKSQALGEGLQAYRLEKLNRYETHLDRKFERTLAMLLKLKSLRGG